MQVSTCRNGHDVAIRGRDAKGYCRECKANYQRRYRHTPNGLAHRRITDARAKAKRREKCLIENRRTHLKMYGLTPDMYNQRLIEQQEKCAVCSRHQCNFRYRLSVDHNHKTGKVRGLLCTHCNSIVVRLVENQPDLIKKATDYLEAWGDVINA